MLPPGSGALLCGTLPDPAHIPCTMLTPSEFDLHACVQFSAAVLRQLVEASQQPDSGFEVCAVVTRRPLSGSGSGRSPGSRGSASQDALQGSPGGSSSSSYQGSTTVHLSQPPPRLRRVRGVAQAQKAMLTHVMCLVLGLGKGCTQEKGRGCGCAHVNNLCM